MTGLKGKIAGLEEQLREAPEAQAATLAQRQAETRGAQAGSSNDSMPTGPRVSTDWRPSGPGMQSRDDSSPDAQGKCSAMMYFPFPVTPDLKKQTFTRVAEEVMPGYIRAGAVPKFGMSPTAMRGLFFFRQGRDAQVCGPLPRKGPHLHR